MENSREKFKQAFPDEHSLIVALHSQNLNHALEGTKIAIDNGAHGVALVTHIVSPDYGIHIIQAIKEKYPYHKAILNILQREPIRIFQAIEKTNIDGIRTDNAKIKGIDHVHEKDNSADEVAKYQQDSQRKGLYFGGLDFKHQKHLSPEEYPFAVQQAKKYLDVITTSGASTGVSADAGKVRKIKSLAGQHPVGLASGVTAANVHEYIENTDISIVASGISEDYLNLNPEKVHELAQAIEKYNKAKSRQQFEQEMLKKYDVGSIKELYDYIISSGAINIGFGQHSEAEKMLSNLYPSPFTLDGVEYASVEGFRMAIKYPPDHPEHKDVRALSGKEAKKAGEGAKYFKSCIYQGQEIRIGSPEHHDLLKRAIRAKLEQNSEILQLLLDTGDKPLIHILFNKEQSGLSPDSKTIPGEKFAQLYTELRDELRNT